MSRSAADKKPMSRFGLWMVFGLCLLIGGGALGIEYMRPHGGVFWLAETPGLRAGIGAGAALAVAIAARLARWLLARPEPGDDQSETRKGGRDAGDRA